MEVVEEIFNRAYKQYLDHLVSYLHTRVHCYESSCEIAHEVFICYFEKLQTGEIIFKPLSWLKATSNNFVANHHRLHNTSKVHNTDSIDNDRSYQDESEPLKLCSDGYSVCKDIVLSQLTYEQRKAFTFIGLDQVTLAIAAQHIGISIDQVSRKYHEARCIVRDQLRQKGIHSPKELL